MNRVDILPSRVSSGFKTWFTDQAELSDRPILLAVTLALQTAFLKSYLRPISVLLIGKPGIGKTRLLSPLHNLDFISLVNDITPKYLVDFLEKAKRQEKKFLVIPDFTNCMSHGNNTRNTLVAIMRNMTEEGVSNLSDYHLEFRSDQPVRAGLITAITSSSYSEFAQNWKKTGFLSRLLPFSFSHSPETKDRIMDTIDCRIPDSLERLKLKINRKPQQISSEPSLLRQLRAYEELLATKTESAPYRHQIQLNALAEACAVLRGDTTIRQDDIDTIGWLSNWINYDLKAV